jgi:hypothetical protein
LPQQVKAEIEQYRRIAGETSARGDVPELQRHQHVEDVRNKTATNIQRLQREAQAAFNSINDEAHNKLKPQPTSTNLELLAEIRRDRAWRRIQAVLDRHQANGQSGGALTTAVRDAARRAALGNDIETLNALDEELPAYFQSQGLSVEETKAAFGLVDEARARTYSPEQTTIASEQVELAKLWNRVQVAARQGEYALKQRIDEPFSIPGSDDGELVTIGGYQHEHSLPQLNGATSN